MSRLATLVVLDPAGALLGELPPVEVAEPAWHEVAELREAVRAAHGVTVQIVRLLAADRPAPPGGRVTYLAQLEGPAATTGPAAGTRRAEPRRAPFAEPGGPAASVRWAVAASRAAGLGPVTAVQQRTWNLSAIWRLDADGRPVAWLKQVPSFYAHEPDVLRAIGAVAPGLVPPVLATGRDGRMLLGHLPGRDATAAGPELCAATVAALHPVQAHFAACPAAAGVPDGHLTAADVERAAAPHRERIDGLSAFLDDLPRRLADVAACGLPDTLLHGDLHPGNVRVDGARITILDWGDAVVGCPAYDIVRLTGKLTAPDADAVIAGWAARWREIVPGSDPERAARLLRPVEMARRAVVNTAFLAAIEPSEQVYHRALVPKAFAAAVALAAR